MKLISLCKKYIFNNNNIKQFLPVSVDRKKITEKVYLNSDNGPYDITDSQWILCQSPFIIGVWISFSEKINVSDSKTSIHITSSDEKTIFTKIEVSVYKKIEASGGTLYLLVFMQVKLNQLNLLKRFLLLKIIEYQRKQELSIKELQFFAGGFSYPRKVILVAYCEENYHNFFPMDFQGYISSEKIQLLGLRKTNITLNKIIQHKKVLVCQVDASQKDTLYMWGKHHSTSPPPIELATIHPEPSSYFGFPVPVIARSYKEIEIVNTFEMGSHFLLIGKEVSEKEYGDKNFNSLYHIHSLQFLEANSKNRNYYLKLD